jgi:hypothetical protein
MASLNLCEGELLTDVLPAGAHVLVVDPEKVRQPRRIPDRSPKPAVQANPPPRSAPASNSGPRGSVKVPLALS